LEGVCKDAGYSTSLKTVLTSEGIRRADLEVFNIRVVQPTDLLVDVTLRHDFFGAGRDGGISHGKLRNPDHPDQNLEGAAAEKIRNYRNPYRLNRQVAFFPACMITSGRKPRRTLAPALLLRKQASRRLFSGPGISLRTQEFCHRRSVVFQQHRCSLGMASAQAVALRGAPTTARRHVAAPRHLPPLNMAYDEYANNERHVSGVA
jgi:hypothetical protein